MEEELGLVGATADDTEAELIRSICEKELLDGKKDCCVPFSPASTVCPNPSCSSDRQSGPSRLRPTAA